MGSHKGSCLQITTTSKSARTSSSNRCRHRIHHVEHTSSVFEGGTKQFGFLILMTPVSNKSNNWQRCYISSLPGNVSVHYPGLSSAFSRSLVVALFTQGKHLCRFYEGHHVQISLTIFFKYRSDYHLYMLTNVTMLTIDVTLCNRSSWMSRSQPRHNDTQGSISPYTNLWLFDRDMKFCQINYIIGLKTLGE